MFYRLRRKLLIRRFNRAINEVLSTPPVPVVPDSPTLVSMVGDDDVPMYVLSMKAFYRRLGRGRIVAIIARTMSEASRAILRQHFPGIELQPIEEIDTGPCQRGGCWERLLYILDRAAGEYVIQVDSDTLPVAEDLAEIDECVRSGTAFTLVDGSNRRFMTLRETADATRRMETDYIGVVVERMLDRYPDCDRLRYVRGSAALAGFPAGAVPRAFIEEFHARMQDLVGARWREWGTEQCASNFAISNAPKASLLPFPTYTSFFPGGPRSGAKFYHFIGSFRFDEGFFAAHGRTEIAALRTAAARPRT